MRRSTNPRILTSRRSQTSRPRSQTSLTTGPIFEQDNFGAMPVSLSVNGTIAPGQYQLSAGSGLGPPTGLPNGINHQSGSGGFDTFSFAVQVPEPTCAFFALSIATSTRR